MKVIMPDYQPTALEVNAIYPQRLFMPAKVSLLLDYLQKNYYKKLYLFSTLLR